jgi:hypothetical protein
MANTHDGVIRWRRSATGFAPGLRSPHTPDLKSTGGVNTPQVNTP